MTQYCCFINHSKKLPQKKKHAILTCFSEFNWQSAMSLRMPTAHRKRHQSIFAYVHLLAAFESVSGKPELKLQ